MLELFLTFAKCGLFTIGGGYAMIAVIEEACVERKNWVTHQEMMDLLVIAESTPGPLPSIVPLMWVISRGDLGVLWQRHWAWYCRPL